MKKYLPVLFLFYGYSAMAQDYRRQDSLVMTWIQNLPYTGIPCEQVRLKGLDTIGKVMKARNLKFMEMQYPSTAASLFDPCHNRLSPSDKRTLFLQNALPVFQ